MVLWGGMHFPFAPSCHFCIILFPLSSLEMAGIKTQVVRSCHLFLSLRWHRLSPEGSLALWSHHCGLIPVWDLGNFNLQVDRPSIPPGSQFPIYLSSHRVACHLLLLPRSYQTLSLPLVYAICDCNAWVLLSGELPPTPTPMHSHQHPISRAA